jgi:endonuclease/exonuclease/phosphatase family metal-dependent hydrolase
VTAGDDASFTVVATGTPPPDYQWRFFSTNLPGATRATLLLTNVATTQQGPYSVIVSNAAGSTNSFIATLIVNTPAVPAPGFNLVTYNVHGAMVADWSTNSAQVQAIGRQMRYLQPDIVTFQEIPLTNTWQMVNFVAAYLPGYALATNSGTDGFIRSVIASRFRITRSTKWLDGVSLTNFGYNGSFTRDLFEVEIAGTNFHFPQPLHVFTTHLRSGQGTDDSSHRAAEANAISNFFVNGFLTTNALRPYLLTGDLNEDIARPPSSNPQTLERLTSAATGLQLTTPLNPFSGSELTYSIQSGLTKRYDYILPCALLLANVSSNQVFRTDLLPSPPPLLLAGDDATASDHLPLQMAFSNPYDKPFRLRSVTRSNATVTLAWDSVRGQLYRVDSATNLPGWNPLAGGLVATGSSFTFSTNLNDATRFFRVYRVP